MNKYRKIDKEFLITDSSLNSYSFRLLTSGYQLDEFKRNPIGYYMHGTPEHPREQGVLVRWEDIRVDGDNVFGKPCVNLTHPRGERTADEIENGFLNAASVGHIVVLEVSDKDEDYLAGQTGPTISKWFNRECSPVDIPGNYNALTNLVDVNDNPINLADFKPQFRNMKQLFLTPAQIALIPNLKADAEQKDLDVAITDLVAKANKVDDLQAKLTVAETAKTTAETALSNLQKETVAEQVKNLLDQGVTDKKLTVEMRTKLATDYAANPSGLKDLLGVMKPIASVTEKINTKAPADLSAKTWEELDKEGKLQDLKAADASAFYEKYKNKFGKSHPQDPSKD